MATDLIRRATRELGHQLGGPIDATSTDDRACLRIPLASGRELRVEQHGDALVFSMQTSISIPRPLSFNPVHGRFEEGQPCAFQLNADERLTGLLRGLIRGAGARFVIQTGYRECVVQAETTARRRWFHHRLGLRGFVEAVERLELLLNASAGQPTDAPNMDMDQIFSSFGEMFGDFFGVGTTGEKGEDLKLALDLDPLEAAEGCEKPLTYQRAIRCPACAGKGSEPGAVQVPCATCKGRGSRAHKQGFFVIQQPCPDCRGTGHASSKPCGACRGEGRLDKEHEVRVTVPPGLADGSILRLKEMGNQAHQGGAGHLYVELRVGAGLRGRV